jgi:hypothetical protein
MQQYFLGSKNAIIYLKFGSVLRNVIDYHQVITVYHA